MMLEVRRKVGWVSSCFRLVSLCDALGGNDSDVSSAAIGLDRQSAAVSMLGGANGAVSGSCDQTLCFSSRLGMAGSVHGANTYYAVSVKLAGSIPGRLTINSCKNCLQLLSVCTCV